MLIRQSFATVAAEFGLTPQNCPAHPAFSADESLIHALDKPGVICLGGYFHGKIVGFAALVPLKRRVFELTRLCVAPEQRGSAFGNRLLDEALRIAQEQAARKITIGIIDANESLKAWYLKRGFSEVGKKKFVHLPFVVCEMEWSAEE